MMSLVLLCVLPAVFGALQPQQRFIADTFANLNGFNLDTLKCDVQDLVDAVGSDPAEQACEAECHKLIADGTVFAYGCPLICHGLQNLEHLFHIVPDTTDASVNPCISIKTERKKRFFLDTLGLDNVFDLQTLKCDVQLMLDVVGTDPAEAACEAECHVILQEGHVLNYGCPLVCQGFQGLVHQWHLVPDTTEPLNAKCHSHPANSVVG